MIEATTFAVVITSYNYRDFVVEAIESALTQSRPPKVVVVVDDGSTDGSDQLLRHRFGADSRVKLIFATNGGQLSAFQQGIAGVSEADVIAFLDSDDRWGVDYLARLGELYDARHDVDFAFSDMRWFGRLERLSAFHNKPLDLGYTAISTFVLTHWYGAPTSALSMRASWARRVVDLPESFRHVWRLSADNCLVFGASILGAHKYYLPTGQVDYRIHDKNGWWSNRSPNLEYVNKMTSSALIRHYAEQVGLGAECVEFSKLEFLTKPRPTWSEIKRYVRLVMMRRISPWRKWGRALNIIGHGIRAHRRG